MEEEKKEYFLDERSMHIVLLELIGVKSVNGVHVFFQAKENIPNGNGFTPKEPHLEKAISVALYDAPGVNILRLIVDRISDVEMLDKGLRGLSNYSKDSNVVGAIEVLEKRIANLQQSQEVQAHAKRPVAGIAAPSSIAFK